MRQNCQKWPILWMEQKLTRSEIRQKSFLAWPSLFSTELWPLETVIDLLYGRNRLKSKEKQGSEDERRKCGR